jgi:predicted alpha/beta-hydrolase family hydrolase
LKKPNELAISVDGGKTVSGLVYEADRSEGAALQAGPAALILAHGAGAGQQSSFMTSFARAIAALGVDVVTFNFPYTEQKRRLPDRRPVLESCYQSAIEAVRQAVPSAHDALFIGGKSMGGRIATQVAAADVNVPVTGLVLLGYPLHPPGKPAERRDAHLPAVGRPVLFVQGSRDAFGTPEELAPVVARMSPPGVLHVVEGGDHSFKVSTRAEQANVFEEVQRSIVKWILRNLPPRH